MAESCIVCLGDLTGNDADASPNSHSSVVIDSLAAGTNHAASKLQAVTSYNHETATDDEETIAHLLPCGHNLHNECLKPWVERANSCPICRASFNMVELSARIGGPVLSSYAVQDKQQVAEIDPSMVVEDEDDLLEDEGYDPCMVCEEYGDVTTLMECTGCNLLCHVFCAGLDLMPSRGPWYCQSCLENPQVLAEASRRSNQPRNPQAFTRGRRRNAPRQPNAWARVWQTVWDRLHLDLDFPFDDDAPQPQRTEAQRREFQEWERRLEVATRNGAGNRFRQTASALLEPHNHHTAPKTPPDPESQEELRAWNAFEKAREQLEGSPSSSNRRKRKSPTSSPAESESVRAPERKLKRPRTRVAHDIAEPSTDVIAESSTAARLPEPRLPEPRNASPAGGQRNPTEPNTAVPGFLQSLLKEVEITPQTEDHIVAPEPKRVIIDRACSPNNSSPGGSPVYPTPRGMTPPPLSLNRPISPQLQASPNLSPGYSPGSHFPPYSPAEEEIRPGRRKYVHQSPGALSSPPRSKDSSPNRANMSYSTKSEIQRMVSAALKPLYLKQEVTKDEYTDINRDVSRMLYDRVGDAGALADHRTREMWQKVASDEVDSAVRALRADAVGAVAGSSSS